MAPSTTDIQGCISLAEKVAFLSDPAAYPGVGGKIEAIETHMSWVFLVGERAFKLKKPVRFAYLDFSTLAERETDSRAELTLNRRLAPDVYLRVAPLVLTTDAALKLGGQGQVVDWLVVMRRLPADRMLDRAIADRTLEKAAIDRLAGALASFYHVAERPVVPPGEYYRRLDAEEGDNRDILTQRRFAIDQGRARSVVNRMARALTGNQSLLEGRAAAGFLVDGHGDLRPEHICFQNGVVIFDCLEFSATLRQVDPVDEIAYLATECARLGADWVGPSLLKRVMEALGWPDPGGLYLLHAARRALLRARLALSHLLDAQPRQPERWEPLATQYLTLAEKALDRLDAG
jgi:uncharacterized protein